MLAGPAAAQPPAIPIELADGKILVPVMLNGRLVLTNLPAISNGLFRLRRP